MPSRNLLIIFLAAIASFACYRVSIKKQNRASKYSEIMDLILHESLIPPDEQALFDASITGMVRSLDEHSAYYFDDKNTEFRSQLEQEFGGVGIYFAEDAVTGRLTVTRPIFGSPAFEAGVMPGDVIDRIDGVSTHQMKTEAITAKIKGKIGSTVELTFIRDGRLITTQLTRKIIEVPSVHGDRPNPDGSWNYRLEGYPDIGYVQVLQFGGRTKDELALILPALNRSTKGLIIDLRNNGGGYLEAAIDICDMFLDGRKKVVETRRRNHQVEQTFYSQPGVLYDDDKPLVILVNGTSASASEITAACLQDYGRAVVIGERTWGKGTVQDVISLDGKRSSLKLTVASYWRPSGKNIHRALAEKNDSDEWGVTPNDGFAIEMTREQLLENLKIRNRRAGFLDPAKETTPDDPTSPADQAPSLDTDQESNTSDSTQIPSSNLLDDPVLKKAIEYMQQTISSKLP